METRIQHAVARKKSGMNCAQAVACTYCDYAGMDEETMAAVTQTFGVGIGATMEGTCGAIIGAVIALGMAKNAEGRGPNMKRAGALLKQFRDQNGAVTCKELKGIGTGVVLRTCDDCVADAARFLEAYLEPETAE